MAKLADSLIKDTKLLVAGMARGATTDLLGAPVDIVASTMRGLGINVGDTPVLGSKYLRKLTNQPATDNPIETIGSMINPAAPILKGAAVAGIFLRATPAEHSLAVSLKQAGKTDQEVYSQTGVFPSATGKAFRTELPDTAAKLTPLGKDTRGSYENAADVLVHPEAYSNSRIGAGLKDTAIRVKTTVGLNKDDIVGGANYPGPGLKPSIDVYKGYNTNSNDEVTGVILHEMQHLVQKQQGMSLGGSPDGILARLNAGQLPGEMARKAESMKKDFTPEEISHLLYWNLAGEVEARAVAARYGMSLKELKQTMPRYDTPSADVITHGD